MEGNIPAICHFAPAVTRELGKGALSALPERVGVRQRLLHFIFILILGTQHEIIQGKKAYPALACTLA